MCIYTHTHVYIYIYIYIYVQGQSKYPGAAASPSLESSPITTLFTDVTTSSREFRTCPEISCQSTFEGRSPPRPASSQAVHHGTYDATCRV